MIVMAQQAVSAASFEKSPVSEEISPKKMKMLLCRAIFYWGKNELS
jgi:hypothetical protein